MQDTIDKIRVASARALIRLAGNALEVARAKIETQSSRQGGAGVVTIAEQKPATLQRFKQYLYACFQQLDKAQQAAQSGAPANRDQSRGPGEESDSISLLDHDYIEAMIAMNGMIRSMREQPIPGMPQFLASLQSLYPNVPIDASNNPLDPEQIGDCFNLAIRPLGLKAHLLLSIYGEFDNIVFAGLGNVIEEMNRLLAISGESSESRPVLGLTTRSDSVNHGLPDASEYEPTAEAPGDPEHFATEKIQERIFDEELDPAIRNLLDTHLRAALVKILMSEGTGGKSWPAVMQTIDVMLWSVQPVKQDGDKERFQGIRNRLLDNLEKALEFSEASKTKTRRALRQLSQIQDYSFLKAATQTGKPDQRILLSQQEPPELPPEDPYRISSRQFKVGTRFEFQGIDGQPVVATLAVRINSIEKLIFTDSRGKKLLELSYNRLANALKNEKVTVVSDSTDRV